MMKWFFLAGCLLQIPLLAFAEDSGASTVLPDSYVSPFSSYQSWNEPTVQDWQETHRQITEESGHAGHQGMTMPGNMQDMPNMPMPDPSADKSKPARQRSPKPDMQDMPKMNHEGMNMNMPGMSHDTMPPKRTPNGGKH